MNSLMTITIQVRNAQAAAAIKNTTTGLGAIGDAAEKAQKKVRAAGLASKFDAIGKAGNQLQWTGRQIEYRFTLPIIAAGIAAGKFANDNEKAFTRLTKVYGGFVDQGQNVGKELKQLRRGYEELSNAFGIAQADVIGLGADFAQAGAEGVANFKLTRLALEAMILGEMDAETAGRSLIAVMAQYGLQIDDNKAGTMDLKEALALLNVVENTTATQFVDLLAVMERAAGSARTAGVDMRELAAMTAAIVPASGTAEKAGNGLRSMLSRLLVPTKDAREVIKLMGMDWEKFNNSTGTERLEDMAVAFEKLSTGQRAQASTLLASRYQVNRFDLLVRDILNPLGRYQTAMKATADATANMTTYQKELMTYIRSSPQAWKILWTQLQNSMARIIVPLMPAILGIAQRIAALVEAFSRLSPETQQWIIVGLALFAVLGPLMATFGALTNLVGRLGLGFVWLFRGLDGKASGLAKLGGAFKFIGRMALDLGRVLFGPLIMAFNKLGAVAAANWAIVSGVGMVVLIAAVVAAVAYLIWRFRAEIGEALGTMWEGILESWSKVPGYFVQFFSALWRIVKSFVGEIAEQLSWLNPFARHSPSLVEQVSRGVDVIASKYASLAGIGSHFRGAIAALKDWNAASADAIRIMEAKDRAEARAEIVTYAPGAGGAFDTMVAGIDRLKLALEAVGREFAAQEFVVADYADALALAEANLERLEATAQITRDALDAIGAELDYAKDRLSEYADAPLVGMRAMGDAIFDNEMAQKALRLELLKMAQAGQTVEDLEDKLARLAGDLELLRGEREGLRLAGAGSDVLGPIDDQIDALQKMHDTVANTKSPIKDVQDQLEELERLGEILDLERALKFDPLTRQIEQLVDTSKEMTFEEAVAGIKKWQPEVVRLTDAYAEQQEILRKQELAIGVAEKARDAAKGAYDREKEALDLLGEAYDAIESQIRDMEGALTGFANSAKSAREELEKLSDIEQAWLDAGDYEIPGGDATIGYEQGDIDALIDQMMKDMGVAFGGLDLFKPIKDWFARNFGGSWDEFWENWRNGWRIIGDALEEFWLGVSDKFVDGWLAAAGWLDRQWESYKAKWVAYYGGLGEDISNAWLDYKEKFIGGWNAVVEWFSNAWTEYKEDWVAFYGGLGAAVVDFWFALKESVINGWNAVTGWLGEAWANYKAKWIAYYGGLGEDISNAWLDYKEKFIGGWNAIVGWLGERWREWKAGWGSLFTDVSFSLSGFWSGLWEGVKTGWRNITSWLGERWTEWKSDWKRVLGDMHEGFKTWWVDVKGGWEGFWNGLVDFLSDFPNKIGNRVRDGINAGINAINKLIEGINAISEKLHLDWEIKTIDLVPTRATGGTIPTATVGAGFVTNGARAIVGEGSKIHPEYVIPTDPRYSGRAASLFGQLGNDLGFFAAGGILDRAKGVVRSGLERAQDAGRSIAGTAGHVGSMLREGALGLIFGPIAKSAETLISLIPEQYEFMRRVATKIKDTAFDWVKGKDRELPEDAPVGTGTLGGGTGWQTLVRYIQNTGLPHVVTSTYRPGGNSYHGKGRAADFSIGTHYNRGYGSPALRNIFEAFAPVMGNMAQLILAGAPFNIKHGRRVAGYAWGTPGSRGNHWNHVHAALAAGGIIPRMATFDKGGFLRPGLTLAYNGTGRTETVTTATGDGPAGVGRELNFYGDLSFPNVRSSDDAEAFIRNLESLVT